MSSQGNNTLGYKLSITDSKGGEIIISTLDEDTAGETGKNILAASYKSDTVNNNATSRGNDIRTEIIVIGEITEDNKDNICKLAEWANSNDDSLYYRKVNLKIYKSDTAPTPIRTYDVEEMFVLDYTEGFNLLTERDPGNIGSSTDSGRYELVLVQRDGKYRKKVFAD